MEDLWCVAVAVFQAWVFVVVFLIMLPAMFGLSLGVTGVYIQILVKILEVTEADSLLSDMSYLSLVVCNTGMLASGEPVAPIHSLLSMFVQLWNKQQRRRSSRNDLFTVGNSTDPERKAGAAQCACASAQW